MKITGETTLKQILSLPGAEKTLQELEIPCMTCPFASMEMEALTIGQIAQTYSLDLKEILKRLNNLKVENQESDSEQ